MQEKLISKDKLMDELRLLRDNRMIFPFAYNSSSDLENEISRIANTMLEQYHRNLMNELELILYRCEPDTYPCGLCREFTEEESKD